MIFVDGSHEYKDVKNDISVYSKFLSENGVLAVHDIHHNEYPGVNKAWNEFKIKNKFHFKEFTCKKYFFRLWNGISNKKIIILFLANSFLFENYSFEIVSNCSDFQLTP